MKFELPGGLEPLRHREGFHRGERGLPDRESLPGAHLHGERHPAHRQGDHPGRLKVGDKVNLETDIIGKYVARLLGQDGPRGGGVTPELLAQHGFL